MINELFLAFVQAATEFLPISSKGHLALFSNLISEPNVFFFTVLHLASLLAVLIFTRREIFKILSFKEESRKMILYVFIATLPAVILGLLFKNNIEESFNSLFLTGMGFIFTGFVLFSTRYTKQKGKLNAKKSLLIGLQQSIALLPGVSRSAMSISGGLFNGLSRDESFRFSFLLIIPLILGAFVLELGNAYFDLTILVAFFVCFIFSLLFLNLLFSVMRKGYFWMFSFYCWFIGIVTLILHFRGV